MTTQPPFADGPAPFRPENPWTSKAAAKAHALRPGFGRFRVLTALVAAGAAGLTDYEAATIVSSDGAGPAMQATTAGSRRGELVADGYAELSTARRPTDTDTLAKVYVATPAGLAALAKAARTGQPAPIDPSGARTPTKPPGRHNEPTPGRHGLTTARNRALEELYYAGTGGLADDELAVLTRRFRTAIGTARRYHVTAGHAEPTGETRLTPAGNRAIVHRITAAGAEAFGILTRPRE